MVPDRIYFVFDIPDYYPAGGFGDLILVTRDEEEARRKVKADGGYWRRVWVLNPETLELAEME